MKIEINVDRIVYTLTAHARNLTPNTPRLLFRKLDRFPWRQYSTITIRGPAMQTFASELEAGCENPI